MRIRWHGHACFEVDGSVKVVTDPHDGKSLGIPPPQVKADVVLVSHDHLDHNCAGLVRSSDATVVTKPVMTVERGVRIEGFTADHDADGGSRRGRITLFKFELDGTTFCHLGDLGHRLNDDIVERIVPVDFLFVPVGDVLTIGPEAACDVVKKVAPKVAVPMHYRVPGLAIAIQPVQNFLNLCQPGGIVKVGNEVEFMQDDLPASGTEVWVFSR